MSDDANQKEGNSRMILETKPCPFCGGKDIELDEFDVEDREGFPVRMLCALCGAIGPWEYAPETLKLEVAMQMWNTRYT